MILESKKYTFLISSISVLSDSINPVQNISIYLILSLLWNQVLPLIGESGLITRKLDDAKAVRELDNNLREMDKNDPVRYDFALFGLGVSERF